MLSSLSATVTRLNSGQPVTHTLVVIDRSVDDYKMLAAGVLPGANVLILDSTRDGIEQITQAIQNSKFKIQNLHILCHGSPGSLHFSTSRLSLNNLEQYAAHLHSWQQALGEQASILLYGCKVAAGNLGQAFITRLSQLTATNVAASSGLIGNRALGGSWTLEKAIGHISAISPFSNSALTAYSSVLAEPVLVSDLVPGTGSSNLQNFIDINGTLVFVTYENWDQVSLWKSNGTAAGTTLLKTYASTPQSLTEVNGTLFFQASDGIYGSELWKSDGTPEGTVLVKDIYNGSSGSNPYDLTDVNGTLFFSAYGDINGHELWKSDGTADGTILVADLVPGIGSSHPHNFIDVNGTLFFVTQDFDNESASLWKSDGTAAGTTLLKTYVISDFHHFDVLQSFTEVNGTLFFTVEDDIYGSELWKSDGTTEGTVLVKDGSSPHYLTDFNSTLFFSAYSDSNGYELWKSDGTTDGTILVADLFPGTGSSYPHNFIDINGTLFFVAYENWDQAALWKSNGTAAGTTLLKTYVGAPQSLTEVNGTLFFTAEDGIHGPELWKSDGTPEGTVLVKDIYSGTSGASPINLTDVNGALFFSASNDINGHELWQISRPTVDIVANISSISEGETGSFTIARGTETDGEIIVNLAIDPSSTVTSDDYSLSIAGVPATISNGTLSVVLTAGQSSVTLDMAALVEALDVAEAADTLNLNLVPGNGYDISDTTNIASITINATDGGKTLAPASHSLVFTFEQYVKYQALDDGHLPSFDEEMYLLANPDVKAAVQKGAQPSGLRHYRRHGIAEGRSILPLKLEIGDIRVAALFDEMDYLSRHSDIANVVARGGLSCGFEHFLLYGLAEGRNPSAYYSEAFYLAHNSDVDAAVKGGFISSGLVHYLNWGHQENRVACASFDPNDYLLHNPDVKAAVQAGTISSAFEHLVEMGAAEGRHSMLLFEEGYYLTQNPDVAGAVAAGILPSGFDHYITYGQQEGRSFSGGFNENSYLSCNQDVAAIVHQGGLSSGMEHYFRYGRTEQRSLG